MPTGKKISALTPTKSPLDGTELVPLADGADNPNTTTQDIADLAGGGGGTIDEVDDGSTTVTSVGTISFTSGATVTDGGGGVAEVAISGGGLVEPITLTEVLTTTFVDASVIGVEIANAGTGGTLGAATVTGTTGTGTKFQAAVTIADSVVSLVVNNAGDGSGTPGDVTITGVTGTGTPFQATGTVDGGGLLTGPLNVIDGGVYTVDPTTTGETVTSDAGLVGATVDLTLTDKPLYSIDSISVAGSYTVPPTDPTAEPVTGGGLTGATLILGLNFAPAIVGSDVSSGYGFTDTGHPILSDLGVPVLLLDGSEGGGAWTQYLRLVAQNDGAIEFYVEGVPDANGFTFGLQENAAFNVYSSTERPLFRVRSNGSDTWGILINASATLPQLQATIDALAIATSAGNRLVIDSTPAINLINAGVNVGVPTGGSQGPGTIAAQNGLAITDAVAIGALPTPALGMFRCVNDAMTPVVGTPVSAGGAATAVVCYGGTQWTVVSI